MATLVASTVAVNMTVETANLEKGYARATKAGESWGRSLDSQIRGMQMGADEAKVYELRLRGADDSVLQNVRSLLKQRDALDAANKAMERGRSITEQVQTPVEKYRSRLSELNGLLHQGAISQQTHARATNQAQTEMQSALPSFMGMSGAVGEFAAAAGPAIAAFTVIAGAALALGAAALTAGGFIAKLTVDAFHSIAALEDQAQTIGISTDALVKLRHAADLNASSAENMDVALTKMVQTLGDASRQGGPAADALNRLGLDVDSLANMSPDQAFIKIAQALHEVTNPAERASLAVDIFGKTAQKISGVFNAGQAGIEQAAQQAELFGIAINEVDAKKIDSAMDSVQNLEKILQGIGATIAVEVAPVVQAVAEKIAEWATTAGPVKEEVLAVMGAIVNGCLMAVDVAQLLYQAFDALFGDVIHMASILVDKLGGVQHILSTIADYLPGVSSVINLPQAAKDMNGGGAWSAQLANQWKDIKDHADAAAKSAATMGESGKVSGEAERKRAAEDKAAQQGISNGENFVKSFEDKAYKGEMGEREAALKHLSDIGQDTYENIARINDAFDQLDANDRTKEVADNFKKMQQEAAGVFAKTRTPLENYNSELDKAKELLDAHLIDLDTYNREVAMAKENFDKSGGNPETGNFRLAAAREVRFNSSIPAMLRQSDNDGVNIAKKTETNTKETTEAVKDVTAAIKENLGMEVVEIAA